MQPAPRYNHRWQRALAWVCLLLAAATAVPIGVSFVTRGDGIFLRQPRSPFDRAPQLTLLRGTLVRMVYAPVELGSSVGAVRAEDIAADKLGGVSPWRLRWATVDGQAEYTIPVWWLPLALGGTGTLLRSGAGGHFSRRRFRESVFIGTTLLFVANTTAVLPGVLTSAWHEWKVPHVDLWISIDGGWCLADGVQDPDGIPQIATLNRVQAGARFRHARTDRALGVGWVGGNEPSGSYWVAAIHLWWLQIPVGAALLWIGIRAYRRGRDADACSACGYSLAGLAGSACPECGVARKEEASR